LTGRRLGKYGKEKDPKKTSPGKAEKNLVARILRLKSSKRGGQGGTATSSKKK